MKKIDIWKLPSILMIHLKRFRYTNLKKAKIKDFVDFQLKGLDLTNHVSRMQRDQPVYDLFSIVNHEGNLGAGHYYSFSKHRYSQQWNYFDDEVV